MNPTVSAIPWYKSPVYISLLVSFITGLAMLFPKVALQLGLGSPDAIQKTAELVLGWVGLGVSAVTTIAAAFGLFKRGGSVVQPITFTQAGADAHPVTVANEKAAADAVVGAAAVSKPV